MPGAFRFAILVLMSCRIGEASHPGPPFQVSCFNPSGLVGKAHLVHHNMGDSDLLLASETHLSHRAMTSFRSGLRHAKSPFHYCVGGHPVPVRHDRSLTGIWRGVAAIAKHPTRATPAGWSTEMHRSCRVGHFCTLLHDMWITSGVLYGECEGPQHPQYLDTNDALLQAVANQVCALDSGPRLVAGDFNVTEGSLAAHRILVDHGFRDIQQLAWDRWGVYPQYTCKQSSRKDFMYLSPELQVMLTGVSVQQGVWSDHAVLTATFDGGVQMIPRFVWPLPWPENFTVQPDGWFETGDVDQLYTDAWAYLENEAVKQSTQHIPRNCTGRGRQRAPKRVVGPSHAPLKAGRYGDVEPTFHGSHLQHARWFHQVRRLQAYVRHVRNHNPGKLCSVELWGSIRRGRGFSPSFSQWWAQSEHRTPGSPDSFPE